jgi:hypothetical protein
VIYICKKNQEDAEIFINDLIQLYCLRHVSNIQKFITKNTVQAALRYFILRLYKQSSRWQDVFDIKQSVNLVDTSYT